MPSASRLLLQRIDRGKAINVCLSCCGFFFAKLFKQLILLFYKKDFGM